MNVEDIIKGCQQYDKKAQFELVKRFSKRLKSACKLYVNDEASANDVLQESFIIIFTKIESFNNQGSFEGWMRKITVRCAFAWLRKRKLIDRTDQALNRPFILAPKAYQQLGTSDILSIIKTLPEMYRLVFSLNVIEGYNHKEISELLKIKEATSRSHLLRARKILQKKLLLNDLKIDRAI